MTGPRQNVCNRSPGRDQGLLKCLDMLTKTSSPHSHGTETRGNPDKMLSNPWAGKTHKRSREKSMVFVYASDSTLKRTIEKEMVYSADLFSTGTEESMQFF